MKWIFVCLTLIAGLFTVEVIAKNCDECSASTPCVIIVPKGDKCNTCEVKVHCSEDHWYQIDKNCTFLDCAVLKPIDNPYTEDTDDTI